MQTFATYGEIRALGVPVVRLFRVALKRDPCGAAGRRSALLAAALGASRAELVTAIADSAHARTLIPLLPGLAPGTPPDDLVAYRLWIDAHDNPAPAALACLPLLDDHRGA